MKWVTYPLAKAWGALSPSARFHWVHRDIEKLGSVGKGFFGVKKSNKSQVNRLSGGIFIKKNY